MIPYVRDVSYVSPSSLAQFETDSVGFYLQRLGPLDMRPERETTFAMEVGTGFDFFAKEATRALLGFAHTARQANPLAMMRATVFWRGYVTSGAFNAFLDLDPVALDVTPGVVERWGVPIRGELDAQLRGPAVFDWKTTGAESKTGASPKPGYSSLFDSREPGDRGPHKKGVLPLEKVDERWASQAGIYHWLQGGGMEEPRVVFDYVCPWPLKTDTGLASAIRVARYDTHISLAFMYRLRKRLRDCWAAIQERRVVDPRELGMGEPFYGN